MTLELANQVAVVTGGSGAIGSAIVRSLAEAGATAVSLDLLPPPDPAMRLGGV